MSFIAPEYGYSCCDSYPWGPTAAANLNHLLLTHSHSAFGACVLCCLGSVLCDNSKSHSEDDWPLPLQRRPYLGVAAERLPVCNLVTGCLLLLLVPGDCSSPELAVLLRGRAPPQAGTFYISFQNNLESCSVIPDPCLDLLWATWLECIWPRTTTCQTWLKNLKRLRRTWKPRRSPLVPDAHLALYSGPTNSVPGPAFLTATSKAVFLFGLRACALPQI